MTVVPDPTAAETVVPTEMNLPAVVTEKIVMTEADLVREIPPRMMAQGSLHGVAPS